MQLARNGIPDRRRNKPTFLRMFRPLRHIHTAKNRDACKGKPEYL
ncbi:hypothetical protein BACEGG_03681 [Bacteroides eggerthii DSM 20697]|nr:hypothetical protein BACEGG_03681 [Bacteroides eggerthii DSM 20697]